MGVLFFVYFTVFGSRVFMVVILMNFYQLRKHIM